MKKKNRQSNSGDKLLYFELLFCKYLVFEGVQLHIAEKLLFHIEGEQYMFTTWHLSRGQSVTEVYEFD